MTNTLFCSWTHVNRYLYLSFIVCSLVVRFIMWGVVCSSSVRLLSACPSVCLFCAGSLVFLGVFVCCVFCVWVCVCVFLFLWTAWMSCLSQIIELYIRSSLNSKEIRHLFKMSLSTTLGVPKLKGHVALDRTSWSIKSFCIRLCSKMF